MTNFKSGDIKPGDFITVRAEVLDVVPGARLPIRVAGGFTPGSIISHEPAPEKPLAVGDFVRPQPGLNGSPGKLIGIHGPWAWVEVNPDRTYVARLEYLERVS